MPPTTLGPMSINMATGVVGVGTTRKRCELEGVVRPAFAGCEILSITTAFFFYLLDS